MKRINENDAVAAGGGGCSTSEDVRKHDTLSRKGASELARQLQAYWHGQGFPLARFWSEPISVRMGNSERTRYTGSYAILLPPR